MKKLNPVFKMLINLIWILLYKINAELWNLVSASYWLHRNKQHL